VPVVVGGTNYYLETLLYDINIKAEDGGDQVKQ
jgi:tRNA A37 N6-isopentenylltransferase MiaA